MGPGQVRGPLSGAWAASLPPGSRSKPGTPPGECRAPGAGPGRAPLPAPQLGLGCSLPPRPCPRPVPVPVALLADLGPGGAPPVLWARRAGPWEQSRGPAESCREAARLTRGPRPPARHGCPLPGPVPAPRAAGSRPRQEVRDSQGRGRACPQSPVGPGPGPSRARGLVSRRGAFSHGRPRTRGREVGLAETSGRRAVVLCSSCRRPGPRCPVPARASDVGPSPSGWLLRPAPRPREQRGGPRAAGGARTPPVPAALPLGPGSGLLRSQQEDRLQNTDSINRAARQ